MPRIDEEVNEILEKILTDSDFKMYSSSRAAARAIRMYANRLKNDGRPARYVYNILLERFNYSEPGAKVVVADIYFDLDKDEKDLVTGLFRRGERGWLSRTSDEEKASLSIVAFMKENNIKNISEAIESGKIEIYAGRREGSLQQYTWYTLFCNNSGLTFSSDEDLSYLLVPTYTQNWSPEEGWKKL